MAKARSAAREVFKQLHEIDLPVYLLDGQQRLLFANEACAAWLGVDATTLQGQTLQYRSPELSGELSAEHVPPELLHGLCPPPQAFAGHAANATVSVLRPDGELSQRRADFFPLMNHAGVVQMVIASVAAEAEQYPSGSVLPQLADPESERLRQIVRQHRKLLQNQYTVAESLLGESPASERVRLQVQLASQCRQPVLLFGPEGSMLDQVAKTIHYLRRPEPLGGLVSVDCATLSPDLALSSVRAILSKPNLHSGGTLLLSHVHLLASSAQPELNRLLLELTHFRVIATSTHSLLHPETAPFDTKLAYQLSTLEIEVLPLISRREDIPVLAQGVLESLNQSPAKQVRGFTPETLDQLVLFDWPKNYEQLVEVITAAYHRATTYEITVADLPKLLHFAADSRRVGQKRELPIVLDEFLQQAELQVIERALQKSRGNKTKAAKLLGLTRPRLYRRMIQLGIATADEG